MSSDLLKQEYKEFYQFEQRRRTELESAVDRPVSLIILFAGILYFILSKFPQQWSYSTYIQAVLIVIATILLLIAITRLVQSYLGYTYKHLPTASDLEEYKNQLPDHSENKRDQAPAKVLEYVFLSYVKAAHHNAQNNDTRSDFIYKSKTFIIWALPIIITLGFVHAISYISLAQFFPE